MRSFQEVCSVQQSIQRTLQTVTIPAEFDYCNLPAQTCTKANEVYNGCAEDCEDYFMTCSEYLGITERECDADRAVFAGCVCDTDHYRDENGDCIPKGDCKAPEGKFTKWSPWGPCSQSCGGGSATRTRICMGGGQCTGPESETKEKVCGQNKCFEEKVCSDLSKNCEGFEEGFVDPKTNQPVDIVVKVPLPDPSTPVDPNAPKPVISIDGVDTTDYDAETGEFIWEDSSVDPPVSRRFSIDSRNQGIMFTDGQRLIRNDDDECEVQNNVDACTNSLLYDQLRLGFYKKIVTNGLYPN